MRRNISRMRENTDQNNSEFDTFHAVLSANLQNGQTHSLQRSVYLSMFDHFMWLALKAKGFIYADAFIVRITKTHKGSFKLVKTRDKP